MRTAEDYLTAGINVIRLQLDGTKQPVGKWEQYQQRFVTESERTEFFGNGQCGIAAVCGPISKNLHVIDIDYDCKPNLDRLFDELPELMQQLVIVQTPRPGIQLWFRQQSAPPAGHVLAYTEPIGEPPQPRGMIETRGSGNYVCAPGTAPETHPNCLPYLFIQGDQNNIPVLADDEVQQLLDTCRSYSRHTPQHVQRQPGEKYSGGEPRPGDVFNQQADFLQLMLAAGWTEHHRDDEAVYLTRPGEKQTPGHSASLGHLRSDDGRPLLHVFTSSASPFEAGQTYDAFGAYATLRHKGDYGAAAAQIRMQYADQVQNAQQQFHAEVKDKFQQQTGADLNYKPFPIGALDPITAAYVQEHAAAIDIDAAYVAVPLLSVLAGLIGPARQIQLKSSWKEPAILWTVTIGKPSSGKSPGWEIAVAPAEQIQRSLHLANQQAREADPENVPPPRQLLVDDITMESLAKVHQNNDRLILTCEELAAWVNGMDQYRGGKGRDNQQWLRMYGAGSLKVNRSTNDLYLFVPRSAVSVTGTIQPKVAAETLFSEKSRNSGFAYRILAVQPPGHVMGWSDSEPPQRCTDDMIGLAQRLFALQQEPCGDGCRPLALPCSHQAQQVFRQFVGQTKEIAEAASDDGESRWVKLRAIAARFALVLSVCRQVLHQPDGPVMQPVDAESMQAGIQLAMWFGDEMERNWLSVSGGDSELMEHYSWVCAKHPQGLTAKVFQQGRWKVKTADDARRWFQLMTDAGLGRIDNGQFIAD